MNARVKRSPLSLTTGFSAFLVSALLLLWNSHSFALTYPLPASGSDVVGQTFQVRINTPTDFHALGREYGIGFYELIEANRRMSPDRVSSGTVVTIPAQFILPPGPRKGIVINIAEMRMYYYPKGQNVVETYPIGIGRHGWQTPVGNYSIIGKEKDPTWRVPDTIREFNAEHGVFLPKIVPPGPDNPLGPYAMRLSNGSYLIHGTNAYRERGVGMRVSSGCIRMFNKDVKHLFSQVPVGTPVRIIDEPYKVGWMGNQLVLEAHEPLQEYKNSVDSNSAMINNVKARAADRAVVNWETASEIQEQGNGIPQVIAYRKGSVQAQNDF